MAQKKMAKRAAKELRKRQAAEDRATYHDYHPKDERGNVTGTGFEHLFTDAAEERGR